jgi:hypothetical protein
MATVTLMTRAFLRTQLEQTPHRLCGGTGRLRPVEEKASVAEARKETLAANVWGNPPLRSLLTIACLLA